MKLAVSYESGQIFQHFGHTQQFKLYSIEDGKAITSELVGTQGSGHGALAQFLKDHGVSVLICGGIGAGAQTALAQAGITLYPGISGDADQAVSAYLNHTLPMRTDIQCNHHGEGHHGNCQGGGCSDHHHD